VTAAGSVVTEDVAPDTLVAGVPAKAKKKLSREDKAADTPAPESKSDDAGEPVAAVPGDER
jgi:serine acetyltransferase